MKSQRSLKNPFVLALIFSFAWHIFWLSAVAVVVNPKETGPAKFSKISFLGPILGKGAISVRIEPRERSLLEKRYLKGVEGMVGSDRGTADKKEMEIKKIL